MFETAAGCNQRLSVARQGQFARRDPLGPELSTGEPHFGQRLIVATWNAQKSRDGNWQRDIERLTREADILLLQEAAIVPALQNTLTYPSIALSEGYRSRHAQTGILSASHVGPLASCTFIDREPVLRTPKASNITSYALPGRGETLLVVNVHAINFSLGMSSYSKQLERIARALQGHDGPIIFAGDFNVWHGGRAQFVASLVEGLGLEEVSFGENNGKTVFGYPLDRIFWRGLRLEEARVERLDSSDHDAMIAIWHLRP